MPEIVEAEEVRYYERRKVDILDCLEENIEKALMIKKRMKEITKGAKSITAVRTEGWGSTEPFIPRSYDTDDAIFMNLGNNEEFKTAKFRIIRNLEEALDLGLERDETPVTRGVPGRYIIPSEFIKNLCEYFKVK